MPSAKRFKHWVTSDVLPSIRKNGGYIANQDNLSDDELLEKALLVAHRKIEERNKEIAYQREQIEKMQPKALFADATATSVGALLGTSNTTTYVESAAGIGQGGRTGH